MFKLTKERYESEENITKRLFDSPIFRLNEENIDDISFPCFKLYRINFLNWLFLM